MRKNVLYLASAWFLSMAIAQPAFPYNGFHAGDNARIIGRLEKRASVIAHDGKSAAFSVGSDFNNVIAPSDEIARELSQSIGKQVIVSGSDIPVSAPTLIKENPDYGDLKKLESWFFHLIEAKKVEPVEFYTAIAPQKVNWKSRVRIVMRIKNPFDQDINIQMLFYSTNGVFKNLGREEKIVAGKTKEIRVDLGIDNASFAEKTGTEIMVRIENRTGRYRIFFEDVIAKYGADGELIKDNI